MGRERSGHQLQLQNSSNTERVDCYHNSLYLNYVVVSKRKKIKSPLSDLALTIFQIILLILFSFILEFHNEKSLDLVLVSYISVIYHKGLLF